VTSGTLVIWSLSRLDNGTRMPYPDGSTGVQVILLGTLLQHAR